MKKMTIQEHKVRINEVLYHIYTNLSTKFSIDELAKISSYSPFHFQRIFKELTQKSVITYIKEARLEWAANLLIFNPESTITEIAHTCGLKSSATFTNEFKKYYEMTPSLWRKNGYKIHKNCDTDFKNQFEKELYKFDPEKKSQKDNCIDCVSSTWLFAKSKRQTVNQKNVYNKTKKKGWRGT